GRGLLGRGAKLFLRAPFLGRTALLDRALHRGALLSPTPFLLGEPLLRGTPLFFGATLVLGSALRRGAVFRGATFHGCALFFNPPLGRCLLGSGTLRCGTLRGCLVGRCTLCSGVFGCHALLARTLLLLNTSLCGRESLLDRALERRVLGRRALFLFSSALLREAPLHGRAFRRRVLFRGTTLFVRSPLLGEPSAFGRARLGRAQLRCDALLFGAARLFRRVSFFFRAPVIRRATLRRLAQRFGVGFFRAPFFFGAQCGEVTVFIETPQLVDGALIVGGALRRDALRFEALRFDATRLFRRAFRRDTHFFGALRLRDRVDVGEYLFVLEDREDVVVLHLSLLVDRRYLLGRGLLVLERFQCGR
ncbi:MAG: hypothetical protein ABI466_07165, partial [Chloroflexota bacterium]